jgi:hypothetical protein
MAPETAPTLASDHASCGTLRRLNLVQRSGAPRGPDRTRDRSSCSVGPTRKASRVVSQHAPSEQSAVSRSSIDPMPKQRSGRLGWARPINAGEISIPRARNPSSARRSVRCPGPQPTSTSWVSLRENTRSAKTPIRARVNGSALRGSRTKLSVAIGHRVITSGSVQVWCVGHRSTVSTLLPDQEHPDRRSSSG